jgi:hypothetical protein
MIKLNIHEYCHACLEFEPLLAQKPVQVKSSLDTLCLCGDTIVECKYRHRCELICNYLKKENSNA